MRVKKIKANHNTKEKVWKFFPHQALLVQLQTNEKGDCSNCFFEFVTNSFKEVIKPNQVMSLSKTILPKK